MSEVFKRMKEPDCRTICIAAMALEDGHRPEITADHIEAHLRACPDCSRELAALREVSALLKAQHRASGTADIWRRIEPRLIDTASGRSRTQSYAFLGLGVFLLAYKLFEMVPDARWGMHVKLIPIAVSIAVFALLRVNPFKVDPDVDLGGVQ